MRAYRIFINTIRFLKDLSFELFEIDDLRDIYNRFRHETVGKYREDFDDYEDDGIKQLLFRYLGYDTRYGFRLSIEIPMCKQIWAYVPYLDDNIAYQDHFQWINSQIERVLGEELPISDIEHQRFGFKETVKFFYGEQEISIEDENLTLLSCEYILRINQLVKVPGLRKRNLYILDYGSIEDVLFSCNEESLEKLMSYLNIESSRIQ